jgi:hypothetical protein
VIEKIEIYVWWQVFFFGLKFCTNVKNKYEKRRFYFIFLRKKSFNWDNFWTLGTLAHQEKPRKNNNSFPYSPVLTGLVQKLTNCTVECFTDCRSRVRIRGPAFDRSLGVHFCRPSQSFELLQEWMRESRQLWRRIEIREIKNQIVMISKNV